MNITILSLRGPTSICDIRGGAREYIQEICKPWVREGHKVTIVCGPEPRFNLYDSEEIKGIKVIRVGKRKRAVSEIIKYYKNNLEDDTDILIENMVSFPMYIPFIKKDKKMYTIVHHLTDKAYFKTQKLPIAMLGYFMERVTLRIFYRKINFIAVSKYTKYMLEYNGIKSNYIDIVNPGIREDYFIPGKKDKDPLIFYVGRYSGKGGSKKVDHLIDAFRYVQKNHPNARLVIAGKGDNVNILKEKSKDLNVEFKGIIDDEEKRYYMQRAWVFASPSLAEGFGITWIEANACGTPVVGYKIEGLDTVNEQTSIMVEPNDINGLSSSIEKLIKDKEFLQSMKNKCIENGNKYYWTKSSMKFINIIKGNKK